MKNSPPPSVNDIFRERFADNFRDHMPLSVMLPTKIGGVADLYVVARQTVDIVDAAKIAIEHKLPYRIVGEGTGILAGESGFPGLIIKNETSTIMPSSVSSRVICASGVGTAIYVNKMASIGLGGMEFLIHIPGTIGGAVATAASAYNQQIWSYVRELSLFDPDLQKPVQLSASQMSVRPLHPVFDNSLIHPPIILTVTLQMARLSQDEILRRLKIIAKRLPVKLPRSLSWMFTRSVSEVSLGKETKKILKEHNIRFQAGEEQLIIGDQATPSGVKRAISLIGENARAAGIEAQERVAYFGYYQEIDDEK